MAIFVKEPHEVKHKQTFKKIKIKYHNNKSCNTFYMYNSLKKKRKETNQSEIKKK